MSAFPVCSRAQGENPGEFPKSPGPSLASESLLDSEFSPLPAQVLLVLFPEGSFDLPNTFFYLFGQLDFVPSHSSILPTPGNNPGETVEPLFTGD